MDAKLASNIFLHKPGLIKKRLNVIDLIFLSVLNLVFRRVCPHADWTPVADEWDGAAGQHPGVRERRLNRTSLGHPDGTVSSHVAR